MSKENAAKFLIDCTKNEALKNELIESLALLAKKAGYAFTPAELKEVLFQAGIVQLSDEDLDKISGGAYPTAVNNQITDSIT